jgi:inosine-uridine nucleoside N-ribohydrolase
MDTLLLSDISRYVWAPAVPLHDPCAVAALAAPELFAFAFARVEVETRGDLTRGMTVMDRRTLTDGEPTPETNCRVATTVDAGRLFDLVAEALAACP